MTYKLTILLGVIGAMSFTQMMAGCSFDPLTGYDELTLEQRSYDGDALRIDGYYVSPYTASSGTLYDTYFFYRTGVIRYVGTFEQSESLSHNDFLDGTVRHQWGVFQVDGDEIAFERWYPPSGTYTEAFIRSGRIIDDTTFVITKLRRSDGGEEQTVDETYHFRPFAPKPDSTSSFLQ